MASILKSIGKQFLNPATLATLGLTAASGGSLSPLLLKSGLSGFNDFQEQGRQDKLNKRIKEAQAFANLQQAVSPRGEQFAPVVDVPKRGFLQKVGQAAELGVNAYDTFKTAEAAQKALQGQQASRALADETNRFALEQAQEKAARDSAQRAADFGAQQAGSALTMEKALQNKLPVKVESLFNSNPENSFTRDISIGALRDGVIPGGQPPPGFFDKLGGAIEGNVAAAQEAENARLKAETILQQSKNVGRKAEATLLRVTTPQKEISPVDRGDLIDDTMARLGRNFQDVSFDEMQQADVITSLRLTPDELLQAENSFFQAQEDQKLIADKFLGANVGTRFNQDKLIKSSSDIVFGLGTVDTGFRQENGVGDVMMTNGFVRINDPGVMVRPAEAKTIQEAQGILQQTGVFLSGESIIEGDKFSPEARRRLMKAAMQAYQNNFDLVGGKVDQISAGLRELNIIKDNLSTFNAYANTYKLPPIKITAESMEIFKRLSAPNGSGGSVKSVPVLPDTLYNQNNRWGLD